MVHVYSMYSNAHALFSGPAMPPAVATCFNLLAAFKEQEQPWRANDDERGPSRGKEEPLSEELRAAFRLQEGGLKGKFGNSWAIPDYLTPQPSLLIGGRRFATHLSKNPGDSEVFFYSSLKGKLIPGKVRKIFSIMAPPESAPRARVFFLALQAYESTSALYSIPDPFRGYPSFGAGVWLDILSPEIELVEPGSVCLCHAAKQPWSAGSCVLKSLGGVSRAIFHIL